MKTAIITWDGFQDQEVIYPYYRLQEEGEVTIFGNPESSTVTGLFGTKFESKREGILLFEYDLIILPGGVKALEKARQHKPFINAIKEAWESKVPIGSICHGSQLLISALSGKRLKNFHLSGYYSIEDDINNAGFIYDRTPVVSNGVSSAAHYKDMPLWMKNTIELCRFMETK